MPDLERSIRESLGDVGSAFLGSFTSLREMQLVVIPEILSGKNVLVCAGTASGKTEAILAPMIRLLQKSVTPDKLGPYLLAVAPTRALVNDLLRRVQPASSMIGWSVGAQTSDHHNSKARPEILITTPESFDSMLARGLKTRSKGSSSHILANVKALFLDEIHCYAGSSRGEQIKFLIQRLLRLTRSSKITESNPKSFVQICAASATVDDPKSLAIEMLGPLGHSITVSGSRKLSVLSTEYKWVDLTGDEPPTSLNKLIWRGGADSEILSKCFCEMFQDRMVKKILVFVPSRSLSDSLAAEIRPVVEKTYDAWVGAHHGSLSKDARESAEKQFSTSNRRAILVATSTLEVGVDIGDIDLVAIWGAPPDVSSLLQRVGRGSRRSETIRILALAETNEELAALSSMLASASRKELDERNKVGHLGVFIQQIASYIKQNEPNGRSHDHLVSLAKDTYGSDEAALWAAKTLEYLKSEEYLHFQNGKYFIDNKLAEIFDSSPQKIHSNIISTPAPLAVRDNTTGAILGHIAECSSNSESISMGGEIRKIINRRDGEILVEKNVADSITGSPPRYPTSPQIIRRSYALHVARGLGFSDLDAPMLVKPNGKMLWFHFAGEIIERFLYKIIPKNVNQGAVKGIALDINQSPEESLIKIFSGDYLHVVEKNLNHLINDHPSLFRASSFDIFLSPELLRCNAHLMMPVGELASFLKSRKIFKIEKGSFQEKSLLGLTD